MSQPSVLAILALDVETALMLMLEYVTLTDECARLNHSGELIILMF